MSVPDPKTVGPVQQGCTFEYSGILTVEDQITPIPPGSLQSLTMILTDVKSGAIINNRNGTDMTVPANGGTFTPSTALFVWVPDPADNPWLGTDPLPANAGLETHLAVFTWTWQNATARILKGSRKVYITVERSASTLSPLESGTGTSPVTIHLTNNVDGSVLVGADVWVTSDDLGLNRASGTLKTDINGNVRFMLVNGGVYYLWVEAPNIVSIQGQQFTAQVDT